MPTEVFGLCCDDSLTRCHCNLLQTIAKVVCAAESQLSTFDFISVDCDLCGRSFIIWQRNSVALMPTVIWVCAVIAT